MTSPKMDTAISAGVWAPIWSPTGEWTPASTLAEKPSSFMCFITAATLILLPIMPT